MLSTCDRALDSRDKKWEELSKGESPEVETLGEWTSHFDPPQCREGDCTTTLRWLVVGAEHRPSLITPPRFAMAVPSMPVKRWNFRKAKWCHCVALTNKFAKTLLPPDSLDVDTAYQDFWSTIKKAPKKTIPRGYQNNYI